MFREILVPIDLTDKSMPPLEAARDLARHRDVKLTLLHVIETIDDSQFDEMKDFYHKLEERSRGRMQELADQLTEAGLRVEPRIVYGKRVREIVRFASENSVDLILLGSHRIDTDKPDQSWATISYQVAILAPCAVLLVK